MIGMNFGAFLTLLVLGLIAAIVIPSIIRYRMLEGFDGFVAMWIAGWIGGWLGSPVLGHWAIQFQSIYLIPAIVGAFVGAFSCAALAKANALATANVTTAKATPTAVVSDMLRKAS
jgi:uncharacterized membrane protein YeaQ/YmgE (transglycosylase-associated protein family)